MSGDSNLPADSADRTEAPGDLPGPEVSARRTPDESTLGLPFAGEPLPTSSAESDLPRLQAGESLAGRFTILRFIARGGMGAVYEANDVMLRSRVALKVIRGRIATDAAAMERFRREVLLARRIGHPNVCHVYELFNATTAAGIPIHFLTMELLDGETLSHRIARQGRLTTAEALPLVRQMCEGLAAAHAEGVVHRDFKSSNVMLVGRGEGRDSTRVAITDFGIARAAQLAAEETQGGPLTGGGAIVGTPEYMAPEQVAGGNVTQATDIYALGIVMYEMVTGKLPFIGDTPLVAAAKRLNEPPPRPEAATPGLDGKWSATILRCLAREPERRFNSALDILPALERPRLRWPRWASVSAVLLALGLASFAAVRALPGLHKAEPARAAVPAAPPSIAVLPFEDESPNHDQGYFSDGIAENILDALAQVEGVKVAGRTSSFYFRGKNARIGDIGRELNVAHVLEGSVQKMGSRVRVTAGVVRVADGSRIWGRTFDLTLTDVFAVQDEIARAVVEALRLHLMPERATTRTGATSDPEALLQFLAGRDSMQSGTDAGAKRALLAFERALSLDSSFALAWVGVAQALFWIEAGGNNGTSEDRRRRALAAAERAIVLAPDLPRGYAVRANLRRLFQLDWKGAWQDLERARALGPGDAEVAMQSGATLLALGRANEARVELQRAVQLDPLHALAWNYLGLALAGLGDHERARAAFDRALEISPGNDVIRWLLFTDWLAVGRPDAALAVAEQATGVPALGLTGVVEAQHDLGHAKESQAALDELIAKYAADSAYQIAEAYAWRGDSDPAFEWLERARTQGDTALMDMVKSDLLLRKIRGDPRFAKFLHELNLPPD